MENWLTLKVKSSSKTNIDQWEVVYQEEDFILLHHFNTPVMCYRTVDEFILIMKNKDKKIIDKCKKYVKLYSEAVEEIIDLEYSYINNYYPEDSVDRIWLEYAEKWEKFIEEE